MSRNLSPSRGIRRPDTAGLPAFLRSSAWNPNRVWGGIFAFWLLILTGVFSSVTGSPGLIQRLKLQSLLGSKLAEQAQLETELVQFEHEVALLEKDRVTQEKEVRRVLGYAAKDEIIFDFSSSSSVALRK